MRHIISLKEQTKEDILEILQIAIDLKAKRKRGELTEYLKNQTLVMLFQKTSTRTRLSFEAAMTELGGHAIFLDAKTSQFSLTDFRDEIQAVMGYGSVLMFRAKHARDVETAASCNKIPVIDACSEKYHPAQALSDLLTMSEYSGGIKNVKKITWLGVENNVSNTLMLACAKLGIEVAIAAPEVDQDSLDHELNAQALETGLVTRTTNLAEALQGTDYIHTDTWMNMEFFENGKVKPEYLNEYNRRKSTFMPFQLNTELLRQHAPTARIMHCMPLHIGYEISRDAVDHPNNVILHQAENRLHMQKAMILWLLGKKVEEQKEKEEVQQSRNGIPEWTPQAKPIYDYTKTYEDNFENGPFFSGHLPQRVMPQKERWSKILGFDVASRIGVPAGPLLNSNWTGLCANMGFDFVTYKTIRSQAHPCHPIPNVTPIDTRGQINQHQSGNVLHQSMVSPRDLTDLAITNSFGVPSMDSQFIMDDIARAKDALLPGQVLIVSSMGTSIEGVDIVSEYERTALMAKEAGADIVEANFSCPNLCTGEGSIYEQPGTVYEMCARMSRALGDTPLMVKVGCFTEKEKLRQVILAAARGGARAVQGINTIRMKIVNQYGAPALGPGREASGVCGHPIHDAAVEWTKWAREIIDEEKLDLALFATGGATLPEHFDNFFAAGADVAMSASGMMWDPYLALRYHKSKNHN
jgi:dihydroorotate dehydrogenase (NAD+) catalytic subunit